MPPVVSPVKGGLTEKQELKLLQCKDTSMVNTKENKQIQSEHCQDH